MIRHPFFSSCSQQWKPERGQAENPGINTERFLHGRRPTAAQVITTPPPSTRRDRSKSFDRAFADLDTAASKVDTCKRRLKPRGNRAV